MFYNIWELERIFITAPITYVWFGSDTADTANDQLRTHTYTHTWKINNDAI